MAGVLAVVAAHADLAPDEAYYALWSRDLAWGYFDHPPMVAAWIRLSTTLFGPNPFGVRGLSIVAWIIGGGLVEWIAWRLFASERAAGVAGLFFVATPLLSAGAIIVTPDTPLVFFSTLALAALVEIWRGGGRAWWAALGLAAGAALLSKFTTAFLVAGVALAMLIVPSLKVWLKRVEPVFALMIAALMYAPFVLWNADHDWATFMKQFGRVPPQGFAPGYVLEFLAAQFALLNPLIAILCATAAAEAVQTGLRPTSPPEQARALLISFVAPALLYFLLHSLHARVEGNWTAPFYPALILLAADQARRAERGLKAFLSVWAVRLGLAFVALAALQALFAPLPLGRVDPISRLAGWRDLAKEAGALAKAQGADFILTRGYALTSELTFYGDASILVAEPDERARWTFMAPPLEAAFAGRGLAIDDAGADASAWLNGRFREVERIGSLERKRGATTLERYDILRVASPTGDVLGTR